RRAEEAVGSRAGTAVRTPLPTVAGDRRRPVAGRHRPPKQADIAGGAVPRDPGIRANLPDRWPGEPHPDTQSLSETIPAPFPQSLPSAFSQGFPQGLPKAAHPGAFAEENALIEFRTRWVPLRR